MRGPEWTDSERFEAVRLRHRGYSVKKIADYLGLSPEFLRAALPYARHKYNSRSLQPDPRRAAQQVSPKEAADGLTRAISDNVSDRYVKRRLKELFGVDLSLEDVDAGRGRMRRGASLQQAFGIAREAA